MITIKTSHPHCVDALNERLGSPHRITYYWDGRDHLVEVGGYMHFGCGRTPEAAVQNFLRRNGLSGTH